MPFRFSIKYLSNVLGFFDFVKDQVPQSLWMQLLIIIIISQDNLVKIIESGPCFFSDKHSFLSQANLHENNLQTYICIIKYSRDLHANDPT